MTRCLNCATEIPDASRFCLSCGKPVTDNSETALMPGPSTPGSGGGESRAAAVRARISTAEGRFAPGTLLAARYQIVGLLGKGGMGEVYRANDLTLDQPVALKFLPEAMARDAGMLARFHSEVRIARQVSHPNVCRVYDIGEADGHPYISMEYIDGEDLGSLLRRIGRLPADKALEFARRICAGLAAAHDKGVLHRDLKPSNIMVDAEGRVFITDFGLAAVAGELRGGEARQGTPAYMAPEQLAGSEVTARSDIYALGLVLYEMFAGKRPFEAGTLAEMVRMQQHSSPASLTSVARDVDPAVERVIQRCLAPDPRQRPVSALAVAAALPGGDPLAAALAAGETPSPDLVASAGEAVGIRPVAALLCLAAAMAGLAGAMLLGNQVQMIGRTPMDNPPEVLIEKARELARGLGYTEKPASTAHGLAYDEDYLQYVERTDLSPARWARLSTGEPPPILFWYRQSPRPLRPEAFGLGMVTPADPPPTVTGMVSVSLDPQGRLVQFAAVPPQVDDTPAPAVQPDWKRLFEAAGLDIARFSSATPKWTPLGVCDARAAWSGSYGGPAPEPLRVEAASWRGKPIYFQIVGPWTRPERMQDFPLTAAMRLEQTVGVALTLLLLAAAGLLARRNARQGRGDRRGAFRLAVLTGAVYMVIWLFGGSHVADLGELRLFAGACGYGLLLGAGVWILYMAVEPFVRRRWPHSMITWNRLLAGRLRDPLVGRDLLVGMALGVAAALLAELDLFVAMRFGVAPSTMVIPAALLDVRRAIAMFLVTIPNSIGQTLFWFLLIFVLRTILRREWLAAAAFVLLFTAFRAFASTGPVWLEAAFAALETALLVFVMLRFGLAALIASMLAYMLLLVFPITADFSAWYAGTSLFALLSLAALAAYAFHAALAGRPLLRDEALE
jgi:predicted Ser/Thr protein kinase